MIEFVNNRAVYAGEDSAKVFITGDVDETMVLELNEDIELCKGAGIKNITFIINSPGGCVSDGMALYDLINSLTSIETVAEIQGICASAATYAALACDYITIQPNANMMIHEPTGGIAGNLNELEADLEYFVDLRNRIIAIYASRMGVDATEVERIMGEAKFLDAKTCKSLNLVDKILGTEETPEVMRDENNADAADYGEDEGSTEAVDEGSTEETEETEETEDECKKKNHSIFSLKNFVDFLKKNKISVIKAEDDEFAPQNDVVESLKNELSTLKTELEAKQKSYDEMVNRLEEVKQDVDKRIQLEVCNRLSAMGATPTELPQPARTARMDNSEFKAKLREIYTTQGYEAAQNFVSQRENGEV